MLEPNLSQYWKTIVDTIQDGVMVVDREGIIVSINKAFERITGFRRSEIIGQTCSVLQCNICQLARDRNGGHWCALFEDGRLDMRQCSLLRKDGSTVHVLKNASLLREGVNVIGAVETLTDITEILEKDYQIEAFRRELNSGDGFQGLLGASSAMHRVFDLIKNAAQSDAPVIIFGESGTGKELVAKAIHDVGSRKNRPFIKVNCAALTESLLESELFGHVKGAYTGAIKSREGRFEAADGGDIFLDEIGDLPLSTQVKLLRVLEEKIIERVGDIRPIPVDVRIITATNKDLKSLVEKGLFREDLYFRINVIPIYLPPLRERVEDIPIFADHFFRRNRLKTSKKIEGVSREAMALLAGYSWPGNVREMRSFFEYAFVTCRNSLIRPEHFPSSLLKTGETAQAPGKRSESREEEKKRTLIDALKRSGGNQSEAARMLGVSRVTIWNHVKKFGIDPKRPADP